MQMTEQQRKNLDDAFAEACRNVIAEARLLAAHVEGNELNAILFEKIDPYEHPPRVAVKISEMRKAAGILHSCRRATKRI